MSRRSATGRAELLLALAHGLEPPLTLDAGDAAWIGYRRKPEAKPRRECIELPSVVAIPSAGDGAPAPAEPIDRRQPLQMETIWAVVERESAGESEAADDDAARLAAAEVRPISEAQAGGLERVVGYEDLLPWARLTPVLQRRLAQARSGRIDLKRLCRQVAAQRPPRRLPRQVAHRWHPDLVVALDFSPRLWPYHWDMHRLCEQLRRQCGRTGLSLRLLQHGPRGGWSPWRSDAEIDAMGLPDDEPWQHPPAGARLLVVGDLGSLSPDPALRTQWFGWIREVQAAGVEVEALLPLGASQLPDGAAALLPLIRWSPDSHLRPESSLLSGGSDAGRAEQEEALKDLLALVSSLRRVDPPLLRALRRALPQQQGDAGLEGAVWSHPDVEAGHACALRPAAAPAWQQRLRDLPLDLQGELQALRRRHHQHLRAALRHEEVLLADTHTAEGTVDAAELGEATAFMAQLAHWVTRLPADAVPGGWQGFAEDAVRRVDAQTARRFPKIYTGMAAVYLKQQINRSDRETRVPGWVDAPELFVFMASTEIDLRAWWIVEDRRVDQLLLQSRAPEPGQRVLWVIEDEQVLVRDIGGGGLHRLPVQDDTVSLGSSQWLTRVEIDGSAHRYVIAPVRRPFGIEGWLLQGFRQGKINPVLPGVLMPQLSGSCVVIDEGFAFEAPAVSDPDSRFHLVAHEPHPRQGNSVAGYGLDRYGVFLDLTMAGVSQRFRHLPPGRFLMGSPPTETGRFDDEGPQHEVTVTRGLWLADTCCTQALWQAVVGGKNPSQFKGDPALPVDSVSWDDVQTFLARLQRQLPPGVEAVLPAEAQWEYACRAGTETAYHFGALIDTDQVNYDGNHPPPGGHKGEYREKTVPVKSLPPNPWGLHEMHGNLWEWCADARRDYSAEPAEDPDGGQDGAPRALRGGAWISGAGRVRSAYRNHVPRGYRDRGIGFRFALRSIEPSAGGGMAGRAEPAGVLPQAEPGAGVGPAEPGPRAEGLGARAAAALGKFFRRPK